MRFRETLIILIGTLVLSLTMIKSGLIYSFGMGFWGPNGHDGVWHIALAESFSRGSFEMPTFAGQILKNYHVGFDLMLAVLHKLTTISIPTLYFQIIPPILALTIGILAYKFVLLWRKSKEAAFWATFFVYFGGSFGWLVSLLRKGTIEGESMFWAQQSISTLINPPYTLSLVLLLAGLIFIVKRKNILLIILCFGMLIQIKAYAGALGLAALLISGVYEWFKNHDLFLLKAFSGSFLLTLILFLLFSRESGSLIVFQPFWFLETMMGLSDRLGWEKFYSAMTNYRFGNIWIKAIPAYLIAFVIFWVGNLGTRIIKIALLAKWLKNPKKPSSIEIILASVIIVGMILPLLFLQKGTPWNTIQFIYYSLFFSGILAGVAFGETFSKSKTSIYFIETVVLLGLTLPTTIGTLKHYLPARPPAMISNEELEALKFLSKQPAGIVLTYPFDKHKAKEAEIYPPRPLYLYESTAYVAAFAKKPVFLEDEVNLDITGYSWKDRKEKILHFYSTLDENEAKEFLKSNRISYIYWIKGQRAVLGEGQLGLCRLFENSLVDIYKVVY